MENPSAFFKKLLLRSKEVFVNTYKQLVNMNDTPHSIAMGFGVGVFLGVLPFTGVVAAVALAAVFRFNKAASFLGSMATNTWFSIVTLPVSLRIGCFILGREWTDMMDHVRTLMFSFSWNMLFHATTMDLLLPVFIGLAILGILFGVLAYVVVFVCLKRNQRA